jgi:hypothetical protein
VAVGLASVCVKSIAGSSAPAHTARMGMGTRTCAATRCVARFACSSRTAVLRREEVGGGFHAGFEIHFRAEPSKGEWEKGEECEEEEAVGEGMEEEV